MALTSAMTADPEAIQLHIEPLLDVLRTAIEVALAQAREIIDERGLPREPFLHSDLVRASLVKYLKGRELPEGCKWFPEANNGVHLLYRGCHVRVLKGGDASLPLPGRSHRRCRYYCQDTAQGAFDFGLEVDCLNLLVLWRIDGAYRLESIQLACTKGGGAMWAEQLWTKTLVHPALEIENNAQDSTGEVEDLPITPKPVFGEGTLDNIG